MGDVRNRGTRERPRWYCRYLDIDGRRKQRATGAPTKAAALRVLADIEERVAQGLPGCERSSAAATPTPASITVAELARRFLEGYAPPRIKDLDEYRRQVRSVLERRVLPELGTRVAASVTAADVEQLRDRERAAGYAAATTTATLRVISKIFAWGIRASLVAGANPCSDVERPPPVRSVDFFSHDEVARLLERAEASSDFLWPLVATGIYAGLRKGELFGLRWRDVELDAGRLAVERSYRLAPKSGKARHLPLHPELVRALRTWRERCPPHEDLVFPVQGQRGELRMGERDDLVGLPELLAAAGVHRPRKPWHALRHTFAAHAVMSGASLYAVQTLLGHAKPEMTQIYAHLAPGFLADEVGRLAFAAAAPVVRGPTNGPAPVGDAPK